MHKFIGVGEGEKKLKFFQQDRCKACGEYGTYEIFGQYKYFSLFCIPLFKWDREYVLRADCCGAESKVDDEIINLIKIDQPRYIWPEELDFKYPDK